MIHILLLILKIIGWILLVILGILILLAGIFLFVPVRYRGDVLGEGEWENLFASLKFSWLCSLVKGEVSYQGRSVKMEVSNRMEAVSGGSARTGGPTCFPGRREELSE